MDRPVIALESVSVEHAGVGRPPVCAVHGVSLRIAAGERIAVFGPNGSGKSTLLRLMAGLERPGRGQVVISGFPTADRELPADVRRGIGFVFQNPEDVFATETVAEEIRFALECRRAPEDLSPEEAVSALAQHGLAHLAERRLDHLSGGEQQLVALCSVLATGPEILFFDEPTSYLDPPSRRAFLRHPVFADSTARLATVLVTQYWEEAAGCRRVLVLEAGQIVYDGPPSGYVPPAAVRATLDCDVRWSTTTVAQLSDPLVVVEQLTQLSAVFEGDLTAPLRDISFRIRPGERVAVVGPTGAGKSTLAYHLAGLMPEYGGSIIVAGVPVKAPTYGRRRPPVAMLFQDPEHHLFAETVAQDVAFGPRNLGFAKNEIDEQVDRCLSLSGLPAREFASCSPFEISAGEQRKAALAGTLALPAVLYIFDEPTAYLDRESAARVDALVFALSAAGRGVIVISHDLPFLRRTCPRWIILDRGHLISDGPLAELERNPAPLESIGFV